MSKRLIEREQILTALAWAVPSYGTRCYDRLRIFPPRLLVAAILCEIRKALYFNALMAHKANVHLMNKALDVHGMNKLPLFGSGVRMLEAAQGDKPDDSRILLGLLNSVERDGGQSQRRLGSELGIALGLVNAYLKRCVKKGLIKVTQAPARRYVYYLTPQGFAEKSRLTVEYLSYSFSFFREAKADCDVALKAAVDGGFTRIVLVGISDLAEIAMICAPENGVKLVAVVDGVAKRAQFVGIPVVQSFDQIVGAFDAALITEMQETEETLERVTALIGSERTFMPMLLGSRTRKVSEVAS